MSKRTHDDLGAILERAGDETPIEDAVPAEVIQAAFEGHAASIETMQRVRAALDASPDVGPFAKLMTGVLLAAYGDGATKAAGEMLLVDSAYDLGKKKRA